MENNGRLPYSDERLAKIMGIDSSEFMFLPSRDEIKNLVRMYNFSLNVENMVAHLKSVRSKYRFDKMSYEGISKLIIYLELR